jgi:signal transduction histidine kinase
MLLYLVNDMNDLYAIRNGKFKKNETQVNIKDTVQGLVDMVAIGAKQKGLEI